MKLGDVTQWQLKNNLQGWTILSKTFITDDRERKVYKYNKINYFIQFIYFFIC